MTAVMAAPLTSSIDEKGAARLRELLKREDDVPAPRTWSELPNIHLEIARQSGDAALAQLHLRRFIDAVKRQDFSPAIEREDI